MFASDILFDEVGNITYFNGQTYTWNANRQLETVTTEDGQLYEYYYNENGFLIKVDTYDNNSDECSSNFSYIWNGDVLVARVFSDYESGETIVSKVIYDSEGEAVGTTIKQKTNEGIFTTQVLLYRKNLQGDITGLIDSVSGQLVAAYTYDAYGMLVTHPINDNQFSVIGSVMLLMALPQAYRGYIFSFVGDELCYYLGSRFYSPRLGRFVNADEPEFIGIGNSTISCNIFAYCNNDPVNSIDPTGNATIDSVMAEINKLLNSIIDRIWDSIKSQFSINKKTRIVSISSAVIATVIDAVIIVVTNSLKKIMKQLLTDGSIRNSFINGMFNFFLNNKTGKTIFWVITRIGFSIAGKPSAVGSITSNTFKGYITNIATFKNTFLRKSVNLISSLSSVGGVVGLFADVIDKKWDGWLRIKY